MNLFQDVIDAYRGMGWNVDMDNIEQCKDQKGRSKSASIDMKEGCQVYGRMSVNRMGGSFHIAPGKSFSINHIHVHDVQPYSSSSFNTSHIINHLSFGQRMNYAKTHLDDLRVFGSESELNGFIWWLPVYNLVTLVIQVRSALSILTPNSRADGHECPESAASLDHNLSYVVYEFPTAESVSGKGIIKL